MLWWIGCDVVILDQRAVLRTTQANEQIVGDPFHFNVYETIPGCQLKRSNLLSRGRRINNRISPHAHIEFIRIRPCTPFQAIFSSAPVKHIVAAEAKKRIVSARSHEKVIA